MRIVYKRQLGHNLEPVRRRRVIRISFSTAESNSSLVNEITPNATKAGEVATATPPNRGLVTGRLHEPPSMRRGRGRPDIRFARNQPRREREVLRRTSVKHGMRVSPGAPALEKFRQFKRSGAIRIATGYIIVDIPPHGS